MRVPLRMSPRASGRAAKPREMPSSALAMAAAPAFGVTVMCASPAPLGRRAMDAVLWDVVGLVIGRAEPGGRRRRGCR